MPPLRLKKGEDRRLRAGHAWVFSNEIDVAQTPLTGFEPGDAVRIEDHRGAPVGSGYVNPRTLIAARMVSPEADRPLDGALLRERLARALRLRERLFRAPFYRLAFGEGDGLPGLVVDRFGEVLVAQITTAGMERLRTKLVDALAETIRPAAVLLRNDTASRALEGLPAYVEPALGTVPDVVPVEENGVHFQAPLLTGQKTGWFYDHRPNRARLQRYAPGARVLDVFSYIGGWGVQAAVAGAAHVLCVDASAPALEAVDENARLNGVAERVGTVRGDAFEVLRGLRDRADHFDVVVLDPPALIKRKKDWKQGTQAYRRLNQLAARLLTADGILVSASCSYHLSAEALQDAMLRATQDVGRGLQLLEQGHQGADHPVHPALPETRYLKAFFGRVE